MIFFNGKSTYNSLFPGATVASGGFLRDGAQPDGVVNIYLMAIGKRTKKWLLKNSITSFEGKSVLITGATSGVGLKSAELMIYLKARVIMACRDLQKARKVKEKFLAEYPDARIDIMHLDLADFKTVSAFVSEVQSEKVDIDVFLNNAGVFHKPGERTADGFDSVLGTNYLGVYYLTENILPYLKTLPHEVLYVTTVSIAGKIGTVDYDDFFYEKKYKNLSVYARSKLCLEKYTCELAKRCEGTNIRAIMSHPGIAITPLGANAFGSAVKRLSGAFGWVFNSPEKSALSLPYIISKNIPAGSLVGPNRFLGGWGYPEINKINRRAVTGGAELKEFTENLINDMS